MGEILLLDCTLRDGGYTNNWEFGEHCIYDFSRRMARTGIDILELGFIRDQESDKERAVWNNMGDVSRCIGEKQEGVQYAVMAEMFNPLPLDKIADRTDETADIIRVIVWKRLMKEGFDYCKKLSEKGYKVCIQPDRVNQYSLEEFREMILMFNEMNPMAVYVVDSNGLLDKNELMRYFETADRYMGEKIKLGYHGHNNKLQALGAAQELTEAKFERDVMIDASISGIGRSSGNLNMEIFADYMNKNYGGNLDIEEMISLYGEYILPIQRTGKWGYSVETFITAINMCNPNYAFLLREKGYSPSEIYRMVRELSDQDKVIFNRNLY